jgi:FixJ family two-component response regulator
MTDRRALAAWLDMHQGPLSRPPRLRQNLFWRHESMPQTPPVISVVDDDLSVRRALRRLVHSAGYVVETFASAREFLDSSWLRGTACLVLDVHLTGMNGFELQERLATDRVTIPIIFITAHDDAATRARVRQSGVAAYLRKPFDKQALLDAIRKATEGNVGGGPAA